MKTKNKVRSFTVSLTPEMREIAENKARNDGRSFSSYVQNLIRLDLKKTTLELLPKTEAWPTTAQEKAETA